MKDPLARFFEREFSLAKSLLSNVRSDLEDLILVCEGTLKQTNSTRSLLSNLTKGVVPMEWIRYKSRPLSASLWISDLSRRLSQLQTILQEGEDMGRKGVNLGLLFNPNAFVTATRQAVAHSKQVSLETLHLQVDLEKVGGLDAFIIEVSPFLPENSTCFNTFHNRDYHWSARNGRLQDSLSTMAAPLS